MLTISTVLRVNVYSQWTYRLNWSRNTGTTQTASVTATNSVCTNSRLTVDCSWIINRRGRGGRGNTLANVMITRSCGRAQRPLLLVAYCTGSFRAHCSVIIVSPLTCDVKIRCRDGGMTAGYYIIRPASPAPSLMQSPHNCCCLLPMLALMMTMMMMIG